MLGNPQKEQFPAAKSDKQLKIGILSQKDNKTYETSLDQMKKSLESLGYNITYIQDAVTDTKLFPQSAKKLVEEGVDIIVCNSTPATMAAIDSTKTIPIVFGSVGDPVANGVVKSLDSSGNNVTGISSLNTDFSGKRLGILKDAFPSIQKVYLVHNGGEIASDNSRAKIEETAKTLGITIIEKSASNSAEVKKVSAELKNTEADAILTSASGMIWANYPSLIEAQERENLPLIGVDSTMSDQGTIISYGPDYGVMGDQLASLIDQILKGSKPQYLPIQRPNKIQLILNKKVAQTHGWIFPKPLVDKASKIIE